MRRFRYGYVTNTQVKMIAGIRWTLFEPKDLVIKAVI